MKHILRKFSRGSILAYSLVLLGIVLVASIGMMAASVTNLKSVSSNDKSINAFQIADSGSQAVIKMLKGAGGSDLGDVTGVTCSGSDAVVESGAFLGGSYKVTFLNSDGETMKCSGAKGKIADVTSVKSVGTYVDTARAVQVAVAAGGCTGNEGQYVKVAGNTTSGSFSSGDGNKINNFLNDGGVLTFGTCTVAGGYVHTILPDSIGSGAGGGVGGFSIKSNTESADSILCSTTFGCNIGGGAQSCSGWGLYGICKPNSF